MISPFIMGASQQKSPVTSIPQYLELRPGGSSINVNIPHSSTLNINGSAISMCAWSRGTGQSSWSGIACKGAPNRYGLQTNRFNTAFEFGIHTNNQNRFVAGGTPTEAAWTHLTGTYDGNILRLYINGSLTSSNSNVSGNVSTNTEPLLIGRGETGGRHWTGDIDQVMLFNRVLSASEIEDIYNEQLAGGLFTGDTNGLVGYWHFNNDDPNDSFTEDSSGTGNDGIRQAGAELIPY